MLQVPEFCHPSVSSEMIKKKTLERLPETAGRFSGGVEDS